MNVSTRTGLYERLKSESLKQVLRAEDNYTTELADSLTTTFLESVKAGKSIEDGWVLVPLSDIPIYGESKILLNVYSIAQAKSLLKSQPDDHQVLLASFCPGVTQTDMYVQAASKGFEAPPEYPTKTSADGADTGVWLALLPKDDLAQKAGKFFGERVEYPFGWENPPF